MATRDWHVQELQGRNEGFWQSRLWETSGWESRDASGQEKSTGRIALKHTALSFGSVHMRLHFSFMGDASSALFPSLRRWHMFCRAWSTAWRQRSWSKAGPAFVLARGCIPFRVQRFYAGH